MNLEAEHKTVTITRPWLRRMVDLAVDKADTPPNYHPALRSVAEGTRAVATREWWIGEKNTGVGCPVTQAGFVAIGLRVEEVWLITWLSDAVMFDLNRFMPTWDELVVQHLDLDPDYGAVLYVGV